MPGEATSLVVYIEKFGIIGLLSLNAVLMFKIGLTGLRQITAGEWVPGRYYREIIAERDRLRSENDAFRAVTLRAVGVAEHLTAVREG